MTSSRDIRTFGILMLVATVVALVFNLYRIVTGTAQPVVVGMLGITAGVGTYVIGEIMRQP